MITNPLVIAAMNDVSRLILMVDVDWPSGSVIVHNRIGEKRWDNRTWIGIGEMGSITGVAAGEKVGQFTLILNSPDVSLLSETNRDDCVGRAVKVYLGALDEHRRIIATDLLAYRFISSVVNKPGKVHNVSISCGGARDRFKSAKNNHRFSSAAWRAKHSSDSYCDEIEALAKGPLGSYDGSEAVGN